MAIQDFTAGQVLTAAQMDALQANDYNQTVSTKTDSYVLVAADKGTRVVMNAATAKTFTVNSGLFAAGDTLILQNIGAGTATVTAGTCTVNTSSSLALAQWGGGTLYFTSASAAIFFSGGGSSYGVATGGTALATPPAGYAGMSFTADGTLTVTKAGLFDVLIYGGGGGGAGNQNFANRSGSGGGGGGKIETTIYLAATTHAVTIGAGGAGGATINQGTNGGYTGIGTAIAFPGGGGGPLLNITYQRGSTGGGGWAATSPAAGATSVFAPSTSFGFSGGANLGDYGGGGGGAGAVGGTAVGTTGGAGGAGFDIATFTGNASSTKGGGGGGGGATGGAGAGGGANGGGTSVAGSVAAANSAGGGGGGGAGTTTAVAGGAGGSGILYIRYKL